MARGAALTEVVARLEERYGNGIVLPGGAREQRRALRTIPFGIASLDLLLEGGLAAGEPHALVGEPSSGTLTLALSLVTSAQRSGGEVAWLDPTSSFDPPAAARAGVDLTRLLLVRADGDDLAFAASVVARSSAFVLVVIDIGALVRRFPAQAPTRRGTEVALATVAARARAAHAPLLIIGERAPARAAVPVVEVRRREWLRQGERLVGWRSEVSRPRDRRFASLAFAPLALPPRFVVDEGVRAIRLGPPHSALARGATRALSRTGAPTPGQSRSPGEALA